MEEQKVDIFQPFFEYEEICGILIYVLPRLSNIPGILKKHLQSISFVAISFWNLH
jgi:hypothetical protein